MTRFIHQLLGWMAVLLLAGLTYIVLWHKAPGADPQHFDTADFCLQHTAETRYDRDGFSAVFADAAAFPTACWQAVELPRHIPPEGPSVHQQDPSLFQAWFRVRYRVPTDLPANEALLVYVPRVMGAAWQMLVDGQPVANNLDDWRMTWNKPLAVRLDPSRVHKGQTLDIRIGVIRRSTYGASISGIVVGPATSVTPALDRRILLQLTMPQASSVVLLLMAAFYFAFWLARPIERTHLLLALASLAWCVCNLQYTLHRPDDPVLAHWYASIVNLAISWVMWLVYLFVLRIDTRHRLPWLEKALPWYVLLMTVVAMPLWPHADDLGVLSQLVNVFVGGGITLLISRQAWRPGGLIELRVISTALILTMSAGAHDVALLAQLVTPESIYLLPYGTLLLFASLMYAVQRRYVAA